jgi:hypothetical protein
MHPNKGKEKEMKPQVMYYELTGQYYVVTRYTIKENAEGKMCLLAHRKFDVTEQIEQLIDMEISRRESAQDSVIGRKEKK